MNRSAAREEIQRLLGGRSDLSADINSGFQLEQIELEKRRPLPWFLESERSSIFTSSGEERVPVPSDFLAEVEDDALWYIDAEGNETVLDKMFADEARVLYPDPGEPIAYNLQGNYFRLFPTPDDAYQLKLVYYQKGDVLSTDVENVWLLHEPNLLIARVGLRVARARQFDERIIQNFADMVQAYTRNYENNLEAREHANQRYVMGGAD